MSLAAVACCAVLTALVTRCLLQVRPPPNLPEPPALQAPLTRKLLFVLVDGLRLDVATDPHKMPHFSRAMRRGTSLTVRADSVSITTSALFGLGTGQRTTLGQLMRNVHPEPPPFDSWLAAAERRNVRVAVAGSRLWSEMYGPWIHEARLDPPGVAIDVALDTQVWVATRELTRGDANVVIAHFVTPDHQGHLHGPLSPRYTHYIRGFDASLHDLLAELGSEWTVIVTSDHGAGENGTHGADVPVHRLVPLFAYGPGIARSFPPSDPVEQIDLAGTIATLLGLPPPRHGRGRILVRLLDLPEAKRAELACADATRAVALERETLGAGAGRADPDLAPCSSDAPPAARIAAASRVIRRVDASAADFSSSGTRALSCS